MAYPNNTYPTAPGFPTMYEWDNPGEEAYDVFASYFEDITTDLVALIDGAGNIELAATKSVYINSVELMDISGGEINFYDLSITADLFAVSAAITTLTVTDDMEVTGDFGMSGTHDAAVTGTVAMYVRRDYMIFGDEDEPANPANDDSVAWLSTGTGYGDAGDLCIKITEGGSTKSATLADYSAMGIIPDMGDPRSVDTISIGGTLYAIVADYTKDAVKVIDINTPASPRMVGVITGSGNPNYLNGAYCVRALDLGGTEHAVCTSTTDDRLVLIDISTPIAPALVAAWDYSSNSYALHLADLGGTEYAFYQNSIGHIAIADISTPAAPVAKDSEAFSDLEDVKTMTIGGVNCLIATNGGILRVWDIDDVTAMVQKDSIADNPGGGEPFSDPRGFDVYTIGGTEYAIVACYDDDAVAIIDISNTAALSWTSRVTSITTPIDVSCISIGGTIYAIAISSAADNLYVINVNNPAAPSLSATLNGAANYLNWPAEVKAVDIGGTIYAVVSSRDSSAVAIINIDTPASPALTAALYDWW